METELYFQDCNLSMRMKQITGTSYDGASYASQEPAHANSNEAIPVTQRKPVFGVLFFYKIIDNTAGTSPITWLKGDSAVVSNTLGVRGEGH